MLAAQAEALDEIVDMGQMVIDPAASERDPSTPGHAAKQLQQPTVAGAVDAGRPDDHDLDAEARARPASQLFAFELGDLVDVARPERRVFVGRRMLHVAVHADRAAMDEPTDAGSCGRFDQPLDSAGVDVTIHLVPQSRFAVHRRDVIDDVCPGRGFGERFRATQIAGDEIDAGGAQIGRAALVADERADLLAARRQRAREMPARKPGRAGD